ncbi:hypothetical protein E2P47_03155 [Candidatus Bathyarchaeota archaeon]|nr:hypothetical protein E2P47_03155 [Candidatus Bathyarchaeota archaeon]
MSKNSSDISNKISRYLQIIVFAVLALSFIALIFGVEAYLMGNGTVAIYLILIGALSMGLAVYVLYQSRKRVAKLKTEDTKVMTTIECRKCKTKDLREFERGDFVFKELDKCDKCEENKIITAIYKEIKNKEKPFTI